MLQADPRLPLNQAAREPTLVKGGWRKADGERRLANGLARPIAGR
jgi:hypothetical protein